MARKNSKVLKFLKGYQVFWDVVPSLAKFYPMRKFEEVPQKLLIEPTNACNLRCPVCPTHFAMKRRRGFLDFGLLESIVDEFEQEKIKPAISFEPTGEPLLNKDIAGFVEYASRNGHKTRICTNGTVLSEKLSAQLIKRGLSAIDLTLDGFSKEAHEAYRVGSDYENVKRNIETFLSVKKSLNSDTPIVTIQTLLTSFSENQLQDILNWADRIGANAVRFKSLSMGSYTTDEVKKKYNYLLPTRKELLRRQSNLSRTLCTTVLGQAMVYWNGDLGLCCVDIDNSCGMPNIRENGFIATWKSKTVVEKRREGFFKQHSICRSCSLKSADYMGYAVQLR